MINEKYYDNIPLNKIKNFNKKKEPSKERENLDNNI